MIDSATWADDEHTAVVAVIDGVTRVVPVDSDGLMSRRVQEWMKAGGEPVAYQEPTKEAPLTDAEVLERLTGMPVERIRKALGLG